MLFSLPIWTPPSKFHLSTFPGPFLKTASLTLISNVLTPFAFPFSILVLLLFLSNFYVAKYMQCQCGNSMCILKRLIIIVFMLLEHVQRQLLIVLNMYIFLDILLHAIPKIIIGYLDIILAFQISKAKWSNSTCVRTISKIYATFFHLFIIFFRFLNR